MNIFFTKITIFFWIFGIKNLVFLQKNSFNVNHTPLCAPRGLRPRSARLVLWSSHIVVSLGQAIPSEQHALPHVPTAQVDNSSGVRTSQSCMDNERSALASAYSWPTGDERKMREEKSQKKTHYYFLTVLIEWKNEWRQYTSCLVSTDKSPS